VEQHHVAGRPFDQGADGGLLVFPDDEVAFPVARDRPVFDFSGTLGDHDHVVDPVITASQGVVTLSSRATASQASRQLPAQLAPPLDEERLVDRLVAHLHHRIIPEVATQTVGDLLG
jgi:hypothetical protein